MWLLVSISLATFILGWGSFVTLFIDKPPLDQGWTHGAILAVIFPLLPLSALLYAFISRSFSKTLLVLAVSIILVFLTSSAALLIYVSQGCPRPRTLEWLEERERKLSNPQQYLYERTEYYKTQRDPPVDNPPIYKDYEKDLETQRKNYAVYKRGCFAHEPGSRVQPTNSENPETYTAFIGSLIVDGRVPFVVAGWFVVFLVPLAFIGKLLGKWLLK